jgi:hypothetical protein
MITHPVGASELPQHRHSGLTGAVFDLPRIGLKIGSERCAFCRRRFNISDDQDGSGPWGLRARARRHPEHKKESLTISFKVEDFALKIYKVTDPQYDDSVGV